MKKRALVTGASRGIGAATARALAADGWEVNINYFQSEAQALALGRELGARVFRADVADAGQVQAMFDDMGPVELLVNNAGIAWGGLITDMTEAEWDRIFAVNVKGLYTCCRAVVPHMVRRHAGSIINVSSIWGEVGASCEVPYSASKAAVIGFTKALAKELGPSGIRVNCVSPGVIATEMNAALDPETLDALREETPLGTIGTPEDAARAILWLAGEDSAFVTGQVLGVNGGFVI